MSPKRIRVELNPDTAQVLNLRLGSQVHVLIFQTARERKNFEAALEERGIHLTEGP